ncbi:hypothetical protein PV11_07501 [Exophiala sideris]|uniref:Uncharacterized protein n=1 Tax=Exophiala sideris TaxID=1016849 RepID=A0A0D1YYX8_9EURO|nr:hypothetical protein PV11_07501 [Exophiala sideris]
MGNTTSRDCYSERVSTNEWHRRRAGRGSSAPSSSAYRERGSRSGTRDSSSSDMSSDISSSLYSGSGSGSDQDYMVFAGGPRSGYRHDDARSSSQGNRLYIVQELDELNDFDERTATLRASDEVFDRPDCNGFRPQPTHDCHHDSRSGHQPRSPSTLRAGDEYLDRPDSTGFRPRRIYNPHGDCDYDFRPLSSSAPRMPTYHTHSSYDPYSAGPTASIPVQYVSPTHGSYRSAPSPGPHPGQPWYPQPTNPPPPYDHTLGAYVETREPRSMG